MKKSEEFQEPIWPCKYSTFPKYGGNNQKINSAHILKLDRPYRVKQTNAYFVSLNIDLFSRKSLITEFRQNADFDAQNFRLGALRRKLKKKPGPTKITKS